jgi:hypothetical protein
VKLLRLVNTHPIASLASTAEASQLPCPTSSVISDFPMSGRKRHFLDLLISFLLFFTPDGYVLDMESLTDPGPHINPTNWESLIANQLKQWDNGNLLVMRLCLTRFLRIHTIVIQATVMLAVDVSFLSIPGVVVNNLNNATNPSNPSTATNPTYPSQEIVFTSPALILIALSIEASVASIVIGMLLIRLNSNKEKKPPTSAVSE